MNRIIDNLATGSAARSFDTAALKGEIFRFVERTLVDNVSNQRRLRRFIAAHVGVQARKSNKSERPPEDLVEEILRGMSQSLKLPAFKTVLPFYR